jgi:hypothetical protein
MDATQGLAAILRDARKGALLRMRSGRYIHNLESGRSSIPETPENKSRGRSVLDAPLEPVIGLAEGETRWRGMTT